MGSDIDPSTRYDSMRRPKVIYIGGPPMVGKTTVARILASRLQYGCVSTDDIGTAITAVTEVKSHPEFHFMSARDYRDYYANTDREKLIRDINAYHASLWPALRILFHNHMTWGTPVILEGWALRPQYVTELRGDVAGLYLLADNNLLESRIFSSSFGEGAHDRKRMLRNYLKRSIRFNSELKLDISQLGLSAITVTEEMKPEEIAHYCLRILGEIRVPLDE